MVVELGMNNNNDLESAHAGPADRPSVARFGSRQPPLPARHRLAAQPGVLPGHRGRHLRRRHLHRRDLRTRAGQPLRRREHERGARPAGNHRRPRGDRRRDQLQHDQADRPVRCQRAGRVHGSGVAARRPRHRRTDRRQPGELAADCRKLAGRRRAGRTSAPAATTTNRTTPIGRPSFGISARRSTSTFATPGARTAARPAPRSN